MSTAVAEPASESDWDKKKKAIKEKGKVLLSKGIKEIVMEAAKSNAKTRVTISLTVTSGGEIEVDDLYVNKDTDPIDLLDRIRDGKYNADKKGNEEKKENSLVFSQRMKEKEESNKE